MCHRFFWTPVTFCPEEWDSQKYIYSERSRSEYSKSGVRNVFRCFTKKLNTFKKKFFSECTTCSNECNFWLSIQNIVKSSGIESPRSDLSESAIKKCFRTIFFWTLTNFCVGIENHKIMFLHWKYMLNYILNIRNERLRSRRSFCATFYRILSINSKVIPELTHFLSHFSLKNLQNSLEILSKSVKIQVFKTQNEKQLSNKKKEFKETSDLKNSERIRSIPLLFIEFWGMNQKL